MLRWLPNFLTLLRIVCALALLILINQPKLIFYVFVLGAVTDWLDGYFAKSYHLISKIGEVLDPIADKALVICALLILMHYSDSLILFFASAIVILREFIVSALRQIMADNRKQLKVGFLSRVKAAMQMLGIAICFYGLAYTQSVIYAVGLILLLLSVFLTVITFFSYIIRSSKTLVLL